METAVWSDTSEEFISDPLTHAHTHLFVDLPFDTYANTQTHYSQDKITTSLTRKLWKSSQTRIVHIASTINIYSVVYVFISVCNFTGPIGLVYINRISGTAATGSKTQIEMWSGAKQTL